MPRIWTYSDNSNRGYGLFKRNLCEELCKHGWDAVITETPLLEPGAKEILRKEFCSADWDWVLLINQTARQFYDYIGLRDDQVSGQTRFLVWFLDDPQFFVDRPFLANEHVFCFDETYISSLQKWQPRSSGFLPLACDIARKGDYKEEYASEVCFVGGLIDQSDRRKQLSDSMQSYVDKLVGLKLEQRDRTFYELAQENPIAEGKIINISPPVAHYLYWEANNQYRIGLLEAVQQEFELSIYGNEDWLRFVTNSALQDCYKGPCDPSTQLPDIVASATINLNIHSVQCRGSLNQRDFNFPVAGGFLLSDWVPAVGRYFIPGEEAVYWSDRNNMLDKIRYYIEHDVERNSIIDHAQKRILRDHTYANRVQCLREILSSQ